MNVIQVDKINNTRCFGDCSVLKGVVRISDTLDGDTQCEASKRNTFFHELVHSILETMGEHELNENERFVCTFSSFLCESILSMEN